MPVATADTTENSESCSCSTRASSSAASSSGSRSRRNSSSRSSTRLAQARGAGHRRSGRHGCAAVGRRGCRRTPSGWSARRSSARNGRRPGGRTARSWSSWRRRRPAGGGCRRPPTPCGRRPATAGCRWRTRRSVGKRSGRRTSRPRPGCRTGRGGAGRSPWRGRGRWRWRGRRRRGGPRGSAAKRWWACPSTVGSHSPSRLRAVRSR